MVRARTLAAYIAVLLIVGYLPFSTVFAQVDIEHVPVLHVPVGSIQDESVDPVFRWEAVDGAIGYAFQIWNQSTGALVEHSFYTADDLANPASPSLVRMMEIFEADVSYGWRIQAYGSFATHSKWAPLAVFNIARQRPWVFAPVGVITDATPEFRWTEIPGAVRYDLWVDKISIRIPKVIREEHLTSTSYTPATPLSLGTYRIWVQAFLEDGSATEWSLAKDFTLVQRAPNLSECEDGVDNDSDNLIDERDPSCWSDPSDPATYDPERPNEDAALPPLGVPRLTGPTSPTSDNTPTFTWTKANSAAYYDLWVDNLRTREYQVIRQQTLTGTSFTPATALAADPHQAWVRAIGPRGEEGEWSPPFRFTITEPQGSNEKLTLTEESLGVSDTVVSGESSKQLFRFRAAANNVGDILLTRLELKADVGELIDGRSYTLKVDTDGDGVVDTTLQGNKTSERDLLIFDDLLNGGFTIPSTETVMFEVHGSMSFLFLEEELSIGFNDNNGVAGWSGFVHAERAIDGSSLFCISVDETVSTFVGCTEDNVQIDVRTATSKVFLLKPQGSLFVTQSSIPVPSRQLLAGATGKEVLRLDFEAMDEPIDVTRLVITNSGTTATEHIDKLKLYREGENTSFASATIDTCFSISSDFTDGSFCAVMESQQLVIPEGDRVNVLVRPQIKSDEAGATQTNTGALRLMVLKVSDSVGAGVVNGITSTGSVTARGFESSNVLLRTDDDTIRDGEIYVGTSVPGPEVVIVGNQNDIVLAKIVEIMNVNPDPNGTMVPLGANKTIAEFKFTAATNSNTLNGRNKATLSGVIFTIDSSNISFYTEDFYLFNKSNESVNQNCVAYDQNGLRFVANQISDEVKFVECQLSRDPSTDLTMDSGESITVVLKAHIRNNHIDSSRVSWLQVSLNDFSAQDGLYGAVNLFHTRSHIQWQDADIFSSVVFDWVEHDLESIPSTRYAI